MSLQKLKSMKSGGNRISLESGQDIVGVFRGEPVVYYSSFNQATNSSIEKEEPFVVNGKSAQQRFKVNFIVKEGDKYVAKVFSGSATTGKALADAEEEYGLDTLFKIKRDGTGTGTKYHIMYKAKLDENQIKLVNAVALNDLYVSEKGEDPAFSNKPESEEEIPF